MYAAFVHAAPHPANTEECARLTTQGVACIIGKTLYDPTDRSLGDEVAVATKFLIEHMGNGSRGSQCYTSQTDRITKLNPQFKVGLYKAISEMERLYGGKNIIQSGFRCDGSNGNHPKGCAVDIIWASCRTNPKPSLWPPRPAGTIGPWECSSDRFDAPEQKWIDANGKNAPYNIHLRLRYYPEGHHVEPVNTQGCVTGATVGSGSPSGSPTTNFANAIRQALGMQQQPIQQPPLPPQPLPQTQPIIRSFDQPVPIVTATTEPDTTPTKDTGPSIADRLEDLVKDIKGATSTQSATSVPLIINGKDVTTIQSTPSAAEVATTSGVGGAVSQNTFVSGDLNAQGAPIYSVAHASVVRERLAQLKAVLLAMLEYLKPFRTRVPAMQPEEVHREYEY